MLLLYFCLDFFQQLLLGGLYMWFWRDWKKMPNRLPAEQKAREAARQSTISYDWYVEYYMVAFMDYQVNFLQALLVLLINVFTQFICVFIDYCTGLHSAAVLNMRLRGNRKGRGGYEPPAAPRDMEML